MRLFILFVLMFSAFSGYGRNLDNLCKNNYGYGVAYPNTRANIDAMKDLVICLGGKDIRDYVFKQSGFKNHEKRPLIITSAWNTPNNNKSYFTIMDVENATAYIGSIIYDENHPLLIRMISKVGEANNKNDVSITYAELVGLGGVKNDYYQYVFFNLTVANKNGDVEFAGAYRFLDTKTDTNDPKKLMKISDKKIRWVNSDGTISTSYDDNGNQKGSLLDYDGVRICELDTSQQGWSIARICL